MSLKLAERRCSECRITLYEFEIKEHKSLCLECYNETHNVRKTRSVYKPSRLRNRRMIIQ